MNIKITELFGWVCVLLILGAYGLVSFNVITASSIIYQLFNFIGAVGIVITSLPKKNYQPVALNITWGVIALIALLKIWL